MNCLLKQVIGGNIEGRIDVKVRRGRRSRQLTDDLKETKKHFVENWHCRRLWTCRKAESRYEMNTYIHSQTPI